MPEFVRSTVERKPIAGSRRQMAASWWNRAPSTAVKARDFEAFWRFHSYAESWLFLVSGTALVLVWFAFGKAADKAAHDGDEIRRSVRQ